MRAAYDIIGALHSSVNVLDISANYDFKQLETALKHNDLAPHPDDMAELQLVMRLDAEVLRRLADKIDVARAELQNDNMIYMNAGA